MKVGKKKEYVPPGVPDRGNMIPRNIRSGTLTSDYNHAEEYYPVIDGQGSLITSEVKGKNNLHVPTLDIDYPVIVIPSSTPGHNHLFIEKEIRKQEYMALLAILAEVGIIQKGFAEYSIKRGYSSVRLPWVGKS